jgi:predicted TIM-barrel fold metal-dependent hydrolase
MIIDVHAHVWPDAVASRALGGAVASLPHLRPFGDGTVAGLRASMEVSGIDRTAAFGIGNHGPGVEKANAFVGGLDRDIVIPFGSVHVDLSVEENLASLARHDLHAVKVHPIFQGFDLDDRRLWAILEAFGDRFVTIVHVGGSSPAAASCTPAMLAEVVRNFPDLRLIACHFGGYEELRRAEESVIGLPVMVDCSWPPSLGEIPREELRSLIRRHGAERVLFGSDWPMADPAVEMAVIRSLGLTDAEEAAILGGNAATLFGLTAA